MVCSVLEFGTYAPEVTREVFPANNYHHNYGDPTSADAQAIAKEYRAFCYPENTDWKKLVWERGFVVTKILLAAFDEWPTKV